MIRLSEIRRGDRVEVIEIPRDCSLHRPLEQFGITKGSILYCRYCSPGAELAALECEGGVIALRRKQLLPITVRYC